MAPEYDELLILAQTLGEVKTKTDKLEAEFSTQAKPFEAATSALYSAISGIKALQFHVLDNNLGKLSTRVEEMRQAINEQVGVIALELKKADAENATKAGQDSDSLRAAIADVQANLGTLANQFVAQLQRVEGEAKEEAKKLQLIPGPAGAAGASLNPRGTFIDGETYNRLDVVTWLGSSYIAAVDGVKEKPSKNSNQWQVLASRGSGGAGGAGDFGSLAGVAQINQGGTGQTTRAAGLNALLPSQTGNVQYMLLTDGAGTVSWGAQPVAGLPSQTSNGGKLLTTDGTNASWSNAVTVSGSNATVAGTLTVNGYTFTSGTLSSFSSTAGIYNYYSGGVGVIASYSDGSGTRAQTQIAGSTVLLNTAAGNALTVNSAGRVNVTATTASTTTSSGALVVSGGVGIAGDINTGGLIVSGGSAAGFAANPRDGSGYRTTWYNPTGDDMQLDFAGIGTKFTITSAGDTTVAGTLTVNGGTASVASANGTTSSMIRSTVGGTATTGNGIFSSYLSSLIEWQFGGVSSDSSFRISSNGLGTSDQFKISSSGNVSIPSTQASTSTSSGALVVSGGVGVAKSLNVGEAVTVAGGSFAAASFYKSASLGTVLSGATGSSYDLYLTNPAGNYVLQVPTGTRNAEFAATLTTVGAITSGAAISTSAPVGGAGLWELGTYTTTAPSATGYVTIEIGGTLYKLLASNV
jgi:hypothetical protein